MLAVIICLGTLLICAIALIIGTGGVRTPPPHTNDKTNKDAPEYLGYLD